MDHFEMTWEELDLEYARQRGKAAEARVEYLEDELSQCEMCERSLLVSEAEAAEMDARDPETARAAGSVKLVVCGHCWSEVGTQRNELYERVKELQLRLDWNHMSHVGEPEDPQEDIKYLRNLIRLTNEHWENRIKELEASLAMTRASGTVVYEGNDDSHAVLAARVKHMKALLQRLLVRLNDANAMTDTQRQITQQWMLKEIVDLIDHDIIRIPATEGR